jgi:hypothetical protein
VWTIFTDPSGITWVMFNLPILTVLVVALLVVGILIGMLIQRARS